MSLFLWLGCTERSIQARGTCIRFVTRPVFTASSCQHLAQPSQLEDHHLSAVRDCLFDIFAAALHTGGRCSIRNPRHANPRWQGAQLTKIELIPRAHKAARTTLASDGLEQQKWDTSAVVALDFLPESFQSAINCNLWAWQWPKKSSNTTLCLGNNTAGIWHDLFTFNSTCLPLSINKTPIQILEFKPLNTKRRPLYLKAQFVPRSKHFSSRL